MTKILVIGGTRFFGKKTVERLIEHGHEVTIATRGNTEHDFGDRVHHVLLDAHDRNHPGWKEVVNQKWEAVFNNVCYTKEEAKLLIDKFTNVTQQLHFTSSMAVYSGAKDGYQESDFDPYTYKIDPTIEVDYGEGKRQAEQVLFTEAPFEVTAYRFPIVLDLDDYTERLHYYVQKALNNETILFEKAEAKINYIKGTTAAESIAWAIENKKEGIYNVSTRDAVTIQTLMDWLEEAVGKELTVDYSAENKAASPFSVSHDQYLISDKIANEGFSLSSLEEWMKPLMQDLVEELRV